jgi:hypothetical protein
MNLVYNIIQMEYLPDELLDIISQESNLEDKINLAQVSKRWYQIVIRKTTFINNLQDLKKSCIKGDLLSIIRSKCYHWVHKIIEWSLRSGKMVIYNWLIENEYDVSRAWIGCYWGGHLELVGRLFYGYSNEGIELACIKGHPNLDKFYQACCQGDLNSAKLLYNPNISYYKEISPACRGGHYDVVVWLTQKEITQEIWKNIEESCIISACEKGNIRVIEHLISLQVITSWGSGLVAACRTNRVEAAKLMLKQGVYCYNDGLVAACKNGSLDTAKLMYDAGARMLNRASSEAVGIDIIKWLIERGANDFRGTMFNACKYGRYHEAEMLKPYFIKNIGNYITIAKYYHKNRIVKLLLN